MGSSSSKFRKHLQNGDEVQALQLYTNNTDLQKALDPNCSYGDSHQHETPLHYAARHGMKTLLRYSWILVSICFIGGGGVFWFEDRNSHEKERGESCAIYW